MSIGPWIENGFYYDFDPPEPFQEKDLRRIKKEMDKIISYKWPFTEEEVTREEAERRIKEQNEPYKLEILKRIKSDRITIWHTSKNQDGWWDLCAGPHVEHTGMLPKDSKARTMESLRCVNREGAKFDMSMDYGGRRLLGFAPPKNANA